MQFALAGGLCLILFVLLANLVVVQYGRGAIRSALDQGARVASLTGDPVSCETRVREVLGQILGGHMGDGTRVSCHVEGSIVVARAEARFESWTPLTPDVEVDISVHAAVEPRHG